MSKERFTTSRRRARTTTLQVLYEVDSGVGHEWKDVIERVLNTSNHGINSNSFVRNLVKGVMDNTAEIDILISRFAQSWPIDQMAAVDRSLLRMAIYELLFEAASPQKVVINEAVEIAKGFGGENSSKFMNGILGALVGKPK
jgi:N utilization substance protein B